MSGRLIYVAISVVIMSSIFGTGALAQIDFESDGPHLSSYDSFYSNAQKITQPLYTNLRISNNPAASKNPRLACDNTYCYIVWQDNRDGNEEIYWCKVNYSGQVVASERDISQSAGTNSVVPDIATDGSGNSYIVWQEGTPWGYINFRKLDATGNIVATTNFTENPLFLNPSIATNSAGESYIAHERRLPAIHYLTVRKLSNTGTILCTQDYSNWDILDTYKYPNVSLNTSGTANVTWRDSWPDFTYRILMAVINSNCSETGPYNMCTSNSAYYPVCTFLGPLFGWVLYEMSGGIQNATGLNCARCQLTTGTRTSADNNNSMPFAAWHRQVASKNAVFITRFYGCPSDWGDVQISNGSGISENPDIAVKKDGGDNWFAVWQDDRDGNYEIYFSGQNVSPPTADVSGFVFDGSDTTVLADVLVEFIQGNNVIYSTMTDANGLYELFGISVGIYTVRYSKPEYVTKEENRDIVPGFNILSTVYLFKDTDGDALLDIWEINGYDHDNDGIVDVNLPAMGANLLRKDIFVEIDWMEAGICFPFIDFESHKPESQAIDKIITAFANAPVDNPDGSKGISLHVDYGQGGLFAGGNDVPHDCLLDPVSDELSNIEASNFDPARQPIFHYCLFAHHFRDPIDGETNRSGIAGVPGSDLIVALGRVLSVNERYRDEQAGTFMHELGHNLNLKHGGQDWIGNKPNYLSVMNYDFQKRGLLLSDGSEGLMDYSRFDFSQLATLSESSLDENSGITASLEASGFGSKYFCGNECNPISIFNIPVDWNCNSAIESGISANINKESTADEVLISFNDWLSLAYDGGLVGGGRPGDTGPLATNELTFEQDQLLCLAIPGDANSDGSLTLADIIATVNYVFCRLGWTVCAQDSCMCWLKGLVCRGDWNGSGSVSLSDVIHGVNYIFNKPGGPWTPIPYGSCCLPL